VTRRTYAIWVAMAVVFGAIGLAIGWRWPEISRTGLIVLGMVVTVPNVVVSVVTFLVAYQIGRRRAS
jgi:hypothetical protein